LNHTRRLKFRQISILGSFQITLQHTGVFTWCF